MIIYLLSIVKDWVRQARAKSTSLLNISGITTHLVLILANVIALHERYKPRPQILSCDIITDAQTPKLYRGLQVG